MTQEEIDRLTTTVDGGTRFDQILSLHHARALYEANKATCPECKGAGFPYRKTQERICYACGWRWEGPPLVEPMSVVGEYK